MNRRGFSLIELVIAIVLIGVLAAFMIPRIGDGIQKQKVRSARNAITTMHARARATAIRRGRLVALVCRSNRILLLSRHPVTGVPDTIASQNLADLFGVTLSADRDSLAFDARGLGMESGNTQIVVSKAGFADTIVISSVGSILR